MSTSIAPRSARRRARYAALSLVLSLMLPTACGLPAAATPTATVPATAVARPTRPAEATATTVPTRPPATATAQPADPRFVEALTLTLGEERSQTLSRADDGDWFTFTPTSGRFYRFATTLIDAEIDTVLTLYDADGEQIAENDDAALGFASLVYYAATDNRPVFLQVTDYSAAGGGLRYAIVATTVSVGEPDAYEVDDRRDVAPRIELDDIQDHSLHSPLDRDYVEFSAARGELYRFMAAGEDTLLRLSLFDEADELLNVTVDELYFVAERDETVALLIERDDDDPERQISYELRVETVESVDVDDFEPDDLAAAARPLQLDEEQRHTFHSPIDRDWVSLDVSAGDVISIATSGLADGLDTVLTLYDADGEYLDYNDDAGFEPSASLITYYAETDATLLVEVSSFSPAEPGAAYRLSATRAEPAAADAFEPDDGGNDAAVIELDAVQAHSFHRADDVDWVQFSVDAGEAYVLETADLTNQLDTVITLYDTDGNEVAANDDYGDGRASRVIYQADADGLLYGEIRAYGSAIPGATYNLTLQLAETSEPDAYEPDDSADQASSIAVGDEQRHTLHIDGDVDWLTLDLDRGQSVVISTSELDDTVDTVLSLYDLDGELLDSNDDADGYASQIEYRATSAQTVLIEVETFGVPTVGAGYTLTVREP
jgi:hypothetical protein